MPSPSCTLSRMVILESHLCETEPGQPGWIRRSGPPWTGVSGAPFMAHTRRLFCSMALRIGTPRDSTGRLRSSEMAGPRR